MAKVYHCRACGEYFTQLSATCPKCHVPFGNLSDRERDAVRRREANRLAATTCRGCGRDRAGLRLSCPHCGTVMRDLVTFLYVVGAGVLIATAAVLVASIGRIGFHPVKHTVLVAAGLLVSAPFLLGATRGLRAAARTRKRRAADAAGTGVCE